ncbi:helix-turn-helix domain-containing protein, partial [Streptomyces sp. NPDC056480]|uniref:helix-turn-helix domain-containing protein n=1 Tax=Streptomyces sp. NPDC056480 TaxID=3345833 RepID=UPI00369EEF42
MLQALGLGRNEEAVYTALLARPTASAQELVRRTGLEEPEVAQVLLGLTERGLVVVAAAGGGGGAHPARGGGAPAPPPFRGTPPTGGQGPRQGG